MAKAANTNKTPRAARKRYGPDAEMAQILHDATLRQYAPLTAEDIKGLTLPEIRQLWLNLRMRTVQTSAKPKAERRRKPEVERILPYLGRRYPGGVPDSERRRGGAFQKIANDMVADGLNAPMPDSFRRAVADHNKR